MIKKGDNVIVITGGSKGQKGKVLKVFPRLGKVVVEGVNKKKKHKKPTQRGGKGQIIEVTIPINASNVMRLDGSKRVRVGKKI